MVLGIDIGNTNIVLGGFSGRRIKFEARMATDLLKTSDQYCAELKSMLGLTCDPVCGLVEVPCIKRNVSGAVNAITAAQMTMAGIKSVIPADEVIDSMRRIGNDMPVCLKETGEGGLAITPTAKVYKQKLNNIDN